MTVSKTSIMTNVTNTFESPLSKLIGCLDSYHCVDLLDDKEETKFDIRNAILVHINSVRTRIPMPVRQYITQWMYSKEQWHADRGNLL